MDEKARLSHVNTKTRFENMRFVIVICQSYLLRRDYHARYFLKTNKIAVCFFILAAKKMFSLTYPVDYSHQDSLLDNISPGNWLPT